MAQLALFRVAFEKSYLIPIVSVVSRSVEPIQAKLISSLFRYE